MNDEPGRPEPVTADDEGLQAFVAVAAEITDEDRTRRLRKRTGRPRLRPTPRRRLARTAGK